MDKYAEYNKAIGQRIKALRKGQRLNQDELADKLGKALRTVQKYEKGEIEAPLSVIHDIANVLGSTPEFILGYSRNPLAADVFEDISETISKTISRIVDLADRHNVDRDNLVRHFAAMFSTMTEISTFSNWKSEVNASERDN